MSSAFTSLTAKFPIKSTTVSESCVQNKGNSSIHQAVFIRYPDRTSYEHRTTKEPVYNHSSVTSSELSEYGLDHVTSGRCSLAIRGFGPRVFQSNPLTHMNPEMHFELQ
ncbi:hypothetical protein BUALT_Bualt01G0092800 [Buddleja alternifolia]|uniref:Uncharacterized protein n=1 Tax=Buddleja alternifolia TaxID=168488 RepID=A0AAV6YE76_9LAMI|nr:hypothetical protein BUALT_Bualt01G0092800 [Buddleja alternifolia]